MSKEMHVGLNMFFHIYRLIAPLFVCVMGTWSYAYLVLAVLVFFAPLVLV